MTAAVPCRTQSSLLPRATWSDDRFYLVWLGLWSLDRIGWPDRWPSAHPRSFENDDKISTVLNTAKYVSVPVDDVIQFAGTQKTKHWDTEQATTAGNGNWTPSNWIWFNRNINFSYHVGQFLCRSGETGRWTSRASGQEKGRMGGTSCSCCRKCAPVTSWMCCWSRWVWWHREDSLLLSCKTKVSNSFPHNVLWLSSLI